MWSSLAERFVCINLLEREDRLQQAKKRFAEVGLLDLMTYHRVHRHPKGGRIGCYESHRSVIAQAYSDGVDSVLIFEDDVLFNEGWEKVVEDVGNFVKSGVPFDTLFLGSSIVFVDEQTTPDIWRVKCFEAHAYIVSRSGMKAYVEGSETFDRLLSVHGQDMIHNSLWASMYSHTSPSICQDDALGTDHIWINNLPKAYADWMQMTIIPLHKEVVKPVIRSKLWQQSWFGRRYVFGMDNCVIDDGRIRVKGLRHIDGIIHFLLIFVRAPPYGYWAFLRMNIDMHMKGLTEMYPRRLKMSRGKTTSKLSCKLLAIASLFVVLPITFFLPLMSSELGTVN